MKTLTLINDIVNVTFNYCVELLFLIADICGTTYEMINIIIFVIGMPGLLLAQFLLIIFLLGKINNKKIYLNNK